MPSWLRAQTGLSRTASHPSPPLWLCDAPGNDLMQGWSLAPREPAAPGQGAGHRASQQQQARPQAQKGSPGPALWGRNRNSVHNCPAADQLHVKRTLRENVCSLDIMLNFIFVFQNICGKFIKFFFFEKNLNSLLRSKFHKVMVLMNRPVGKMKSKVLFLQNRTFLYRKCPEVSETALQIYFA